jgi:single-strand DNA-binding protein
MAYSINKVTLLGNVGKDPEIRTFQNGGKIATFSLATTESWKDKTTGEKKAETEWHNIVVKNEGLVGIIEKYVKKGSKLYLEGKLETRKFTTKEGAEKYTTEVVLYPYNGEIVLLDAKDAPADAPAIE